jgi:hypothetical protein
VIFYFGGRAKFFEEKFRQKKELGFLNPNFFL